MAAPPLVFVVRRGALERFRLLEASFAPEDAQVIWDRRVAERRAPASAGITLAPDRRRRDRRGAPPPSWMTLDFVTVAAGVAPSA